MEMRETVTAMDVAKLAGVSQSSVSRVYFEGASVSDKTRKRVLEAAAELGYRPNVYARSLITNQSKIIGLVMKSVQNPFYAHVLKRFSSIFKQRGYSILFVSTNNDEIQDEDVETLLNYHVAGVIVTDATMSETVGEEFKKNQIPLVFFNRKPSTDVFHSVSCNNLEAGRSIAHFLVSTGSNQLVLVTGNEDTSTSIEREKGFCEVLDQQSITYRTYNSDYTYEGGYDTAISLLEENKLPSAIFVANDIMALGVLDALRKHEIQIPEHTRVVGFDNIGMASWPAYDLTTWEQPIEEMIEATVTYLMEEVTSYTGFVQTIEVDGKLIERKTT
ncbi:LacI family transcriptional regulator [Sporosarcina sp. P31]|nr:LacI family transcriptional regulator [Sporosarcina sp. P29]PID06649.1 LacI family transcriptional regulator [Sporosarcina sp. P30]PID09843.1 LacI family transcriptional regulator [Sporosarcina sp. P31]PID13422.1 LacI family transcriptional regulator [Sporosarcina sp. P32b]